MMKISMKVLLVLGLFGTLCAYAPGAHSGSDPYENLEFFLERALKQTRDPDRRLEILNQYTIKALGLLYEQNRELIRLNRETIGVLQDLLRIEQEENREMESRLREMQNRLPTR
jgi:hypothetical protein